MSARVVNPMALWRSIQRKKEKKTDSVFLNSIKLQTNNNHQKKEKTKMFLCGCFRAGTTKQPKSVLIEEGDFAKILS